MSDRELLELAAKAAGLWDAENGCIDIPWNPLTDDGDALRLAVKLRISLIFEQEYMGGPVLETLEATSPPRSGDGSRDVSTESLSEGDEMANTRRAIVRAAALIYQSTKPK